MEFILSTTEERELRSILANRGRRLVGCYTDQASRVWAVSRKNGVKTCRDDQRHLLDVLSWHILIERTVMPSERNKREEEFR